MSEVGVPASTKQSHRLASFSLLHTKALFTLSVKNVVRRAYFCLC